MSVVNTHISTAPTWKVGDPQDCRVMRDSLQGQVTTQGLL